MTKKKNNKLVVQKVDVAPEVQKIRKELPAHLAKEFAKVEDVGTTVLQTSQQMLLAMQQILEEDFHFTDDDLFKVHRKFQHMLMTLAELPDKGIFVLGSNDMKNVKRMAESNMTRLTSERKKQLEAPKEKKKLS